MTTRKQRIISDSLVPVLSAVDSAHESAVSLAAADASAKDATTKALAADDATVKANNVKSQTDAAIATVATASNNAMTAAQATPSRIRNVRVGLPQMLVGASQAVNVVWPTPFADVNYTVPMPGIIGSATLGEQRVSNITKEGCTITLKNVGVATILAGAVTLHVLAIHDAVA